MQSRERLGRKLSFEKQKLGKNEPYGPTRAIEIGREAGEVS
jgi:hypothetical protein